MEEIVWRGKPTVLAFYDMLACGALLIAVSIAVALIPFIPPSVPAVGALVGAAIIVLAFLRARANTYIVSKDAVRREYKLIAVENEEIPLEKVTNVVAYQDVVGRILGFGTVRCDSAGTSFMGVAFKGVKNPRIVEDIIRQQLARTKGKQE